ncbi:hypothetical protein SRHO_G00065400 [Serrasalmus rhombeus]
MMEGKLSTGLRCTTTTSHVDNSGLLFYYTAQLWHCCDNATDFLSYGLCDAGYIPQVISEAAQDLQVFSVILHTHLAGRKGWGANWEKTKTILLGDKLLVECTYNTGN